jgi:hypothetical protein
MLSMHRQLTLNGSTTLTNDIKVLPKNDGEIYPLWTGRDRHQQQSKTNLRISYRIELTLFFYRAGALLLGTPPEPFKD